MAKKYQQKYNKEVTLKWFVSVAFDAMNILIKAMEQSGTKPSLITKGLYAISDYKGISSTINISPAGSSLQYEQVYQIKDSKFVLAEN